MAEKKDNKSTKETKQSETQAPERASAQTEVKVSAQSKKTKMLKIVGGAAGLVLVVIAAYLGINLINTPTRVKEQVIPANQYFSDHKKIVDKIGKHLLDESGADDAEEIEREVQKAKDYLEEEAELKKNLDENIAELTARPLNEYKQELGAYLAQTQDLVVYEDDLVRLMDNYVGPMQEIEDLSVANSGVSNYLYSDPNKYVEEVEKYIDGQNKIIEKLEAVEPPDRYQEIHQSFIKNLKVEIDFVSSLKDSVDERDQEAMVTAQQEYAKKAQEAEKEYDRISDDIDDKVEDLLDKIDDQAQNIENLYSNLKSKYKF